MEHYSNSNNSNNSSGTIMRETFVIRNSNFMNSIDYAIIAHFSDIDNGNR